ncbi:MAG: HAMP domain-containing histidine kinase [Deltaproteobacteria bacterium]|nr:HAMP domain-containing histidine kinase [Deltaproteobacteria bacterium]
MSLRIQPDVVGRFGRLRVEQVLVNLLTNAVKYGGGTPIDVFLDAHATWATLSPVRRRLHAGFELSADAIVHVRTEGATNFQAGNMLQADVGASHSLGRVAPVLELNGLLSERDIEEEEILENSGLVTLYVSPGVRAQ